MPGFNVHIAVGNEYMKKNNIKNRLDFLKGIIIPDLSLDKSKSHYSGPIDKSNLINSLKNKVNLRQFVLCNNIDDDYTKGFFLHLLTDYYFYNYFFEKKYLKNVSWDKFKNDLYYSLDKCDLYIKRKYRIEYEIYKKEILDDFNKYKDYRYSNDSENIINLDQLNKFINKISSIDLNNIKENILNNNDI